MTSYHAIITHMNPDLDGLTAAWLLKKFGEDKFPGISQAKIKCVENQGKLEEMDLDNAIVVDMGRGEFDHHSGPDSECSATLVAKKLGIEQEKGLKNILEFVKSADLEGHHDYFDISNITKMISRYLGAKDSIDFVFTALEAEYQRQKEYQEAKNELNKTRKKRINIYGRPINLVAIQSDNPEVISAISSEMKADIIIRRNSSGNVQIITYRKGQSLNLKRLVRALRFKDSVLGEDNTEAVLEITEDDHLSGKWYYWKDGNGILNGSNTAEVEPTALTLAEVVEAVKDFTDKSRLHDKCPAKLSQGKFCCMLTGCPWYEFMFLECEEIRNRISSKSYNQITQTH